MDPTYLQTTMRHSINGRRMAAMWSNSGVSMSVKQSPNFLHKDENLKVS